MPVLTELLHGDLAPKSGPLDAFNLARRRFMANERIDMGTLAGDLDVSRVTLNRWVGSRDLLLAEILWSLAQPSLEASNRACTTTGGAKIADVVRDFSEQALSAPYLRGFLTREPEIAMRVLMTARTPFQARVADWITELIQTELQASKLPMPPNDLGYLIVRIGETFCYLDLIADGHPDPKKAHDAIAAMLR